jgi:hypothetical protein
MQKGLWFLLEVVLSMSKDESPILLHCKVNWSIVMHLQGHRLVRLSSGLLGPWQRGTAQPQLKTTYPAVLKHLGIKFSCQHLSWKFNKRGPS